MQIISNNWYHGIWFEVILGLRSLVYGELDLRESVGAVDSGSREGQDQQVQ